MIDLQSYRIRIGTFNNQRGKSTPKANQTGNFCSQKNIFYTQNFLSKSDAKDISGGSGNFISNDRNDTRNFIYLLYFYFIVLVWAATMLVTLSTNTSSIPMSTLSQHEQILSSKNSLMLYVKCFYCILISYIIKSLQFKDNVRNYMLYKLLIKSSPNKPHGHRLGRLNKFCQSLFLWLCIINFLLITIVNPSLLNPGPLNSKSPKQLSVHYQNVQRLIPFSQLKEKHPTLNSTKINEIGLYLYKNNPDVIVLNETWLKESILDNEIIPTEKYEVFRLDRSSTTHPPDPNNAKKFRENGGGVLIGIKKHIGISCKVIPVKCRAEILSIELTEKSGRKTILSTFYRVGNLGSENHSRIEKYITAIRRRRKVSGIFIIGDMNFPKVNWETFVSTEPTEQLFLNTFGNLALEQLVDTPTHIKGNILDYLITDNAHLVNNLTVDPSHPICGSDHHSIKFDLSLNTLRKKPAKRTIYNFKHADWDSLNSEFLNINWELILAYDNIEYSWKKFKSIFFQICNKHTPNIKVSNEFKPPWYDSEIFELDRKKARMHALYKQSGSDLHHAKFCALRRDLENLIKQKMDSNFEEEMNRNFITKKLYSYAHMLNPNLIPIESLS